MTGLAPAVILWLLTILGVVAAFSPLPRQPEPVSALGSSEGDDGDAAWTDEHGTVRVPREDVREGWLP